MIMIKLFWRIRKSEVEASNSQQWKERSKNIRSASDLSLILLALCPYRGEQWKRIIISSAAIRNALYR
jgi:hypothetical protein